MLGRLNLVWLCLFITSQSLIRFERLRARARGSATFIKIKSRTRLPLCVFQKDSFHTKVNKAPNLTGEILPGSHGALTSRFSFSPATVWGEKGKGINKWRSSTCLAELNSDAPALLSSLGNDGKEGKEGKEKSQVIERSNSIWEELFS